MPRSTRFLAALIVFGFSALSGVSANASGTVPFVGCPTQNAQVGGPIIPSGGPVQADLPANIAAKLAFYSNDGGYMSVFAPRGWACDSWIQMGLSYLRVYPANERDQEESGSVGTLPDQRTPWSRRIWIWSRHFYYWIRGHR
jgi:hypothetical protein